MPGNTGRNTDDLPFAGFICQRFTQIVRWHQHDFAAKALQGHGGRIANQGCKLQASHGSPHTRLGRRLKVNIPPEFEAWSVVFIYASLFLGEVKGYYARFWWWDLLLHTGSGLLLGTLGPASGASPSRDSTVNGTRAQPSASKRPISSGASALASASGSVP